MQPQIKKNVFGKYEVKYDCPKCATRLTSPLSEAGDIEHCPECAAELRVPGKKQREAWEKKVKQEQAEKEHARKEKERARKEKERVQKEEARARKEKERARQEEEREQRQLMEWIGEPEAKQPETSSSRPPFVQGEIVGSSVPAGGLSDTAECPFCAEVIASRARKCKHCGELLDPVLRAAEEGRRTAAMPQIVNVVHGGNATAVASATAEASSTPSSSCAGCVSAVILIFLLLLCAGALSGG
ncbi:hypothetical protein [Candidatus Laterigemmans baculatus]|uniref:hypothetical protein n=1 Tax=Candidatus Laterigemmans baculatus TaxID=2770505 RepID=UPI0013DCDDC9|nr:hypothetical protein [Candidatus Laterigemmans baculatus]